MKILVVDDSKQVLLVTEGLLERLGFAVTSTLDPREGFALANQEKPDLILCDIMMPGIDGFKFCQLMKAKEETRDIPIIMVTAKTARKDILRARQVGAANYLIKPVTTSILKDKIGAELRKLGKDFPWEEDDKAIQKVNEEKEDAPVENSAPRKKFSLENSTDPEASIRYLLKKAKELLALPFTVSRTLKVTSGDDAGAKDLAKIISSDVSIASMVLKKANSAFYGTSRQIMDVKGAIVRIGFNQTRSIVLGLSVIDFLDKDEVGEGFDRITFWEHSLGTAVIAQLLADRLELKNRDDAFISGLLHDIGKIVLDENASEEFQALIQRAKDQGRPLIKVEMDTWKFDHGELGLALLNNWNMPDICKKVSMTHEQFGDIVVEADAEMQTMMKIVYYSHILTKALGFGFDGDNLLGDIDNEGAEFLRMNMIPKGLIDDIHDSVFEYKDFLGAKLSTLERPKEPSTILPYRFPTERNLHMVELYLNTQGYDLEGADSLVELANHFKDKPEYSVYLAEYNALPAEGEWDALKQILAAGISVILLAPKKVVLEYKEELQHDLLTVLAKPVDRDSLKSAIAIALS